MRRDLLDILACPACAADLELKDAAERDGSIESGSLVCRGCSTPYPIVAHVPRFVPPENYAGNWGIQWNAFRQTQLDSHSGVPISRDRFFASTGWPKSGLEGKRILDVGCGAGRFAEIALSTGANVVAVDYSSAADACFANHGANPRINVLQGDVYRLPFKPASFDYVYCLGVLQHTPDPEAAFRALPKQVKPSGKVSVDLYPKTFQAMLSGKYWVRPVTKRIKTQRLFGMVQKVVPLTLPIALAVGRIPLIGRKLRQLLPIANYEGIHPLNARQVREWAVLDTFDMLAPVHDHPQTAATVQRWLESAGLRDIEVFRHGHLIGRGTK